MGRRSLILLSFFQLFALRFNTSFRLISRRNRIERLGQNAHDRGYSDDLSYEPKLVCTAVKNSIRKSSENIISFSLAAFLFVDPARAVVLSPKAVPITRPLVYSIEWTDPPCLQPRTKIGEVGVLKRFGQTNIVILGGHKDSKVDENLQFDIISRLYNELKGSKKKLAIGLSWLPCTNINKASLNEYTQGSQKQTNADEEFNKLLELLQFGNEINSEGLQLFKPIIQLARSLQLPLVPLGPDPSVIKIVRTIGFDGLSDEERSRNIPDPQGYVDIVKQPAFQRYTKEVIFGPLSADDPNVVSSSVSEADKAESLFRDRIFRDEVVASNAARYIAAFNSNKDKGSEGVCLVVLASVRDVVFGYGLPERAKRNLDFFSSTVVNSDNVKSGSKGDQVLSVLLNPVTADSLALDGIVQLRLALAYGSNQENERPLSDFLWFSSSPSVKLLTRPKNPISREGDKPAGESSILKAF